MSIEGAAEGKSGNEAQVLSYKPPDSLYGLKFPFSLFLSLFFSFFLSVCFYSCGTEFILSVFLCWAIVGA